MIKEENEQVISRIKKRQKARKCWCLVVGSALLITVLLILFIILALTVFKAKQPKTKLLSATIQGVSPRITFPVINIQLNITLGLQFLVENRNHASFKHGAGKSFVTYRGNQFGEADIPPGFIPATGSNAFTTSLVLQIDEVVSNVTALVNDVLDGELVLESRTVIPGRIAFLKIFKKHAVATSECQFTIAVLAFKIQSQKCKSKL